MKSILRMLDLMFVITGRARKARIASRYRMPEISMDLLYDGGLDVKAKHLLPELKAGRPQFDEPTRVRLFRVIGDGVLQEFQQDAIYHPGEDAFRLPGGQYMPRGADDRWLHVDEYPEAFRKAVDRVIAERGIIEV